MAKRGTHQPRRRYYFYLNPYRDAGFTRCPKCENKTNVRKFPLAIHIEPRQLFVVNKICPYCTRCELIIAKKSELEAMMATGLGPSRPEIVGNDYFVFGVLERKDWLQSKKGKLSDPEAVERAIVFKDVLNFKPVGGWVYDPEAATSKRR